MRSDLLYIIVPFVLSFHLSASWDECGSTMKDTVAYPSSGIWDGFRRLEHLTVAVMCEHFGGRAPEVVFIDSESIWEPPRVPQRSPEDTTTPQHPRNKSIARSTDGSIDRSINQSINPSLDRSIARSPCQSRHQRLTRHGGGFAAGSWILYPPSVSPYA